MPAGRCLREALGYACRRAGGFETAHLSFVAEREKKWRLKPPNLSFLEASTFFLGRAETPQLEFSGSATLTQNRGSTFAPTARKSRP